MEQEGDLRTRRGLRETAKSGVDMLHDEVNALVSKVGSFRDVAGVGTLRKSMKYLDGFVIGVASVNSTTQTILDTVDKWTDGENSLKEVETLLQEVVKKADLKGLVDNIGTGQKAFISFGAEVAEIAAKVADKFAQGVSVANKYVNMAEDIIKFIDTFNSIEELVRSVTDALTLTTPVNRNEDGCYRKDDELLPDLCVSQTEITPAVSLYKKVWFPMEMMFLNMLSTKSMFSGELVSNMPVSEAISTPSSLNRLGNSLCC